MFTLMSPRLLALSALVWIPLVFGAGCGRTKCADCVEDAPGSNGAGKMAGAGGQGGGAGDGFAGRGGSSTIGGTAAGGAAGTAAGGAGGGGQGGAGGAVAACPPPASTVCASPAPSFAATITPILDRSCNTCHAEGNPDGVWPLHAYADVAAWSDLIVPDLVHCTMPPAGSATPFPESDRQLFFAWLACGSPDN